MDNSDINIANTNKVNNLGTKIKKAIKNNK